MPMMGNPTEYKFNELESFSLLDVSDNGHEVRNRMLVIKLRSAGEIPIVVPRKVTHEDLRRVLQADLPECMPV